MWRWSTTVAGVLSVLAMVSAGSVRADDAPDTSYDALKDLPTIHSFHPVEYVCASGCAAPMLRLIAERSEGEHPFVSWSVENAWRTEIYAARLDFDGRTWRASRYVISGADLRRAWFDRLPLDRIAADFRRSNLPPDSEAWKARLARLSPDPAEVLSGLTPLHLVADSGSCPGMKEAADGIAQFESFTPDIPGVGVERPDDEQTFVVMDGGTWTVKVNTSVLNQQFVAFSVSGNVMSAPYLWVSAMEKATAPCWKPAPPEAGA